MNIPTVQYPTDEKFHVLGGINRGDYRIAIVMRPLSDVDVSWLNNNIGINVQHFGKTFILSAETCFLYGDVNLEDKDDIDFIRSCKWLSSDSCQGHFIPANYDYENNTGSLITSWRGNRLCQTIETFDNLKMFKFAYACIGKPKNVAVYSIRFKRPTKYE